ncbi:MAG: DUF2905 domain-containing protein [Thermoleophilia bacterium]|nr:DUF2905 domain-containing protein [Thermoleophilia bacterium]
MNLEGIGKLLLGIGAALVVMGGILYLVAKLGWTKLPGDFVYRGKNIVIYVPFGLMILVSLIGSLILHILSRR